MLQVIVFVFSLVLFVFVAFSACIKNNTSTNTQSNTTVNTSCTINNKLKTPEFPLGKSDTFYFSAQGGEKIVFLAKLMESNDWFIALHVDSLYPSINISDISGIAKTYDAGTEADGIIADQPKYQVAPNTGAADSNNKVRSISTIVPPKDYIKGSLTYESNKGQYCLICSNPSTRFTLSGGILITGISNCSTYDDNCEACGLYKENEQASIELERLAEDGNNNPLFNAL